MSNVHSIQLWYIYVFRSRASPDVLKILRAVMGASYIYLLSKEPARTPQSLRSQFKSIQINHFSFGTLHHLIAEYICCSFLNAHCLLCVRIARAFSVFHHFECICYHLNFFRSFFLPKLKEEWTGWQWKMCSVHIVWHNISHEIKMCAIRSILHSHFHFEMEMRALRM